MMGRTMKRKSYNLPYHAHFLTFSVYRRQQLLTNDHLREELLHHWDIARHKLDFAIWSYVIMPEHVHLLIYPRNEQYAMPCILRSLKESFARWVVRHWEEHAPHLLTRISVKRGPRALHRFWQEGGGYDRNLFDWDTIERAIDYIEMNPVRRGLVTDPLDWKWSSARHRVGSTDTTFRVDPIDESRVPHSSTVENLGCNSSETSSK
ncbi:MAG: hypothetical protein GF341_04970 [candidate division Zixibacteria bacterium]|nr:hypothetical protein [candidate division Zixibacteria bacterium]